MEEFRPGGKAESEGSMERDRMTDSHCDTAWYTRTRERRTSRSQPNTAQLSPVSHFSTCVKIHTERRVVLSAERLT